MKRLFRFFTKRWVITALGILAVVFLIWVLGPLIGFADYKPLTSPLSRLITVLVVLTLWGLNLFRAHLKARRTNEQMAEDMADTAGASPGAAALESEEELAELRKRFQDALGVLKKSKAGFKHGHQYLYQLPWYIIIGPPGSGKTTALVNSGLHFPLGDRFGEENKVRGIGGTRNCDWWFTDEAILLDTAGRYTTQDSHMEVDKAAWTGFLSLLKKHRRRRPINGALVAVSVVDLLQQSETERADQVRVIKQRIQELHETLGIRFPIYVLFTKCDLLAGFIEFFDDLGRDERAQVWGITFPADTVEAPAGAVGRFADEFTALEQRLNTRLSERLQTEHGLEHRELIYTFPRQFRSLKGIAERFIGGIFQPSQFETPPILRGVYFSSGTQEGAPIDRLMGNLARTFGLERTALASYSGSGRSYFITRLFHDVIFHEAALAGTNLRTERQRTLLQRGAYAGAAALTVLTITAWLISYSGNLTYITEVSKAAETIQTRIVELPQGEWDLATVLPILDAAYNIPGGFGSRDEATPLLMGFGLYQGDKLGSQAQSTYRSLLDELFLPMLVLRLEEQLRQWQDNPEFLYEALKVYLMLGEPKHFDEPTVRAWIELDWQKHLPHQVSTEQRQGLKNHLRALLQDVPHPLPFPLDAALIEDTRTTLAAMPMAKRVYGRLVQIPYKDRVPDFRVTDAAGENAAAVFTRQSGVPLTKGIPGLYTKEGYHKLFLKETPGLAAEVGNESWILGAEPKPLLNAEELSVVIKEVRKLYFQDYIDNWETLLGDVEIVPFKSFRQAAEVANLLSDKDSPMRQLLVAVAHETALEPENGLSTTVEKVVDEFTAVKERLARLLEAESSGEAETETQGPANPVDRHFAQLHELMRPGEEGAPPIDSIVAMLDGLYVYLSSVDPRLPPSTELPDSVRRIGVEAKRQPIPLNRWLEALASSSSALTRSSQQQRINAEWRSTILPFCRRAISNRYPLVRNKAREVTLEDFGRFFGPGGLVNNFLQKNSGSFSKAMSRKLGHAEAIRDAFFPASGQAPAVNFTLTPTAMDKEIIKFVLDVDGQQVVYDHGPVRPTNIQWPAPRGSNQVRLMMLPPPPTGPSSLTERGPWAWFRLLDKAKVESTSQPEEFRVTFQLGDRKVTYLLTASSVQNPFRLKALNKFRCPENL